MTRTQLWLAIVSVVVLTACSGESGSPHTRVVGARPVEAPNLEALRSLLMPHAAATFDAGARERGCPDNQTLGEYLAMLVHNGAEGDEPGDVHRLTGGCVAAFAGTERMAIDPPVDPAYWMCRIDSYVTDPAGESPWHYELRVRVRRADAAPDLRTMACPGAP